MIGWSAAVSEDSVLLVHMHHTVENNAIAYSPPKYQLLKWVGNKQKFAAEITRHFPLNFCRYYEPFLGSAAILATVAPNYGLGSDTFKPLIEIWKKLVVDPGGLVEWYSSRRKRIEKHSKEEVYDSVLASYNSNPNGADFLFLCRACYGGIIRFRKADGYMSTPCGVHEPISVEGFESRVLEWRARLRSVKFEHCDYKETFSLAKKGDLIYCDPPYVQSQSILYGAQDFCFNELIEEIDKAKQRGVKVALSIDGHKKSGHLVVDLSIPRQLFKNEILIDCGHSMLRRFQLEGMTMEDERVHDRLLMTY